MEVRDLRREREGEKGGQIFKKILYLIQNVNIILIKVNLKESVLIIFTPNFQ